MNTWNRRTVGCATLPNDVSARAYRDPSAAMKITYANTKNSAVRMPIAVPPSDATNDTIVDGFQGGCRGIRRLFVQARSTPARR